MESPTVPGPGAPGRGPAPADVRRFRPDAGPRWPGTAELRADLRSSLAVTGVLLTAGLPAGLLWWALAPRARFEVTADGAVVLGRPSAELLIADDSVYTLVLAGLGLLAGVAVWRLRRRRGVAVLLALAIGTLLAAVVAWQVGEALGPGPTADQLADVGAQVTTALRLSSVPPLAVGPFAAVLAYVMATLLSASEDLDRPDPGRAATGLPDEGAPESAGEPARQGAGPAS